MRVIASLRRNRVEFWFGVFVVANVVVMALSPRWETIPFHWIWISLTLLYGVRVWPLGRTYLLLIVLGVVTGGLILLDSFNGTQTWGELFEVPLMSAMFLAMVWHARRRQEAIRETEALADERASLLTRQEQFLHDVSHELRTPVTIARGHLEQLQRANGEPSPEATVALDELERMARIVDQLLLLANAGQPNLSDSTTVFDIEHFIEDVVIRWAEVAPRVWRVGELAKGTLRADPDALRIALDALVENAVNHTEIQNVIEVRSVQRGGEVAIEVADEGCGVPPAELGEIFERFARADTARTRAVGGSGLGLAIVEAIAQAHGGCCAVSSSPKGSKFTLVLPGFRPAVGDGNGRSSKTARPPAEEAFARG